MYSLSPGSWRQIGTFLVRSDNRTPKRRKTVKQKKTVWQTVCWDISNPNWLGPCFPGTVCVTLDASFSRFLSHPSLFINQLVVWFCCLEVHFLVNSLSHTDNWNVRAQIGLSVGLRITLFSTDKKYFERVVFLAWLPFSLSHPIVKKANPQLYRL